MPAGNYTTSDVTSQGMADLGKVVTDSAYARDTNAQATHTELDNALRMKLMRDAPKLLQQGQPGAAQPGDAQDPTSNLMRMGEWYTEMGDPVTGGKIMEQASLVGSHQSSVLLKGLQAQTLLANQQQQQLEQKGQMLGMVQDEASWRQYLQETGHSDAVGKQPYPGADGIRFMQEHLLKLKDQLTVQGNDKRDAILNKYRETQNRLAESHIQYFNTQKSNAARSNGKGKDPRLVPSDVLKDATAVVKSAHGAWDTDRQSALAWQVADDANQAMQKNKALSLSEAIKQSMAAHEGDAKRLNAGPNSDQGTPPLPPGFVLGTPDEVDITNLPEDDAGMNDAMNGSTGEQ
jgi:hypothetical protein